MSARRKTRGIRAAALTLSAVSMLAVTACGDDDFENEPRPAVPIQITGVITEERLTVSPNKFGAGPIVLTIANQTDGAHTVSLEGEGIQERVGPVSPEATATIQKTLKQGQYVVKAGSDQATDREIRPATVVVGQPRDSASDELLLP